MVLYIVMTLLMNAMMLNDKSIDQLGHMGGLISGIILGLVILAESGRMIRVFAWIGVVIFYIGGIVLFYTVREPKQ